MGSDWLDELQKSIADAAAGDQEQVIVELARDRYPDLGAALDAATGILEGRGWHLAKVLGEADSWVATYRRDRPRN